MYNPTDPLAPATNVHLGKPLRNERRALLRIIRPKSKWSIETNQTSGWREGGLPAPGSRENSEVRYITEVLQFWRAENVISVWRPLYHVVKDWPLIVCDGSSVTYKDMLEVDLIRRDYIGSTMFAKYRPGYRWYYLAAQQPHEVCLFKNFDSATSVKAQSKALPHLS
jgi:hypothetical protein